MSSNSGESSSQKSTAELEKEWESNGLDVVQAPKEFRDLYVKMRLRQYEEVNLQDFELWEQYREDFAGWTISHFRNSNPHATRILRHCLRAHGVWVGRNNSRLLSEALYDTLQEDQPGEWSKEEIEEHVRTNGEFKSRKIAWLIKSGGSTIRFGSTDTPATAPFSTMTPNPSTTPAVRDYSRDITNLSKLYTGDSQKYSGQNDNFDFHLTIFNNYCSQLNIDDDAVKAKAYSTMLKGQALEHFFINLRAAGATVSFDDLCNATRNYFETPEYRRAQLSKWNATTLRTVIAKNTEKSTAECLHLLVTQLRHLQPSLDFPLRTDAFLHNKLITACQDISSCQYACYKPAETLSGLINDLDSSITTYEKTHPPSSSSAAFFTDRRFHRDQQRFPSRNTRRFPSRRPQDSSRSAAQKRCFVCKKEGCWSMKHT